MTPNSKSRSHTHHLVLEIFSPPKWVFSKHFFFLMCKSHIWPTCKILKNSKENIDKRFGLTLYQRCYMNGKHLKRCSTSLVSKEMQLKPPWDFTTHPLKWQKQKAAWKTKCYWRDGAKECSCFAGRNAKWYTLGTVWCFLKALNTRVPYGIPRPGSPTPRETKAVFTQKPGHECWQ